MKKDLKLFSPGSSGSFFTKSVIPTPSDFSSTKLLSMSDPALFSLAMSTGPLSAVKRTTHIETDLEEASYDGNRLRGALAPQQMQTFRLFP